MIVGQHHLLPGLSQCLSKRSPGSSHSCLPSVAYPVLRSLQSCSNMTRDASPLLPPPRPCPGTSHLTQRENEQNKASPREHRPDSDLISSHSSPCSAPGTWPPAIPETCQARPASPSQGLGMHMTLGPHVTFSVNPHKASSPAAPTATHPPLVASFPHLFVLLQNIDH